MAPHAELVTTILLVQPGTLPGTDAQDHRVEDPLRCISVQFQYSHWQVCQNSGEGISPDVCR